MASASKPDSPAKPARGRAGGKVAPAATSNHRAERTAERRAAIIDAALEEFIARGFTATRLDDIARRAGVAKGTIYLHFRDKESMFEELISTAIVPLLGRLSAITPPSGGTVRAALEQFALTFQQEVAATR